MPRSSVLRAPHPRLPLHLRSMVTHSGCRFSISLRLSSSCTPSVGRRRFWGGEKKLWAPSHRPSGALDPSCPLLPFPPPQIRAWCRCFGQVGRPGGYLYKVGQLLQESRAHAAAGRRRAWRGVSTAALPPSLCRAQGRHQKAASPSRGAPRGAQLSPLPWDHGALPWSAPPPRRNRSRHLLRERRGSERGAEGLCPHPAPPSDTAAAPRCPRPPLASPTDAVREGGAPGAVGKELGTSAAAAAAHPASPRAACTGLWLPPRCLR